MYISRDYAAALATAVKKRFLGPLGPGKIPQSLFLKPNPLSPLGIIAKFFPPGATASQYKIPIDSPIPGINI